MTQGQNGDFVAATYAERGVAVPFTTPQLAQGRMRPLRKGEVEFLLPGFNDVRGGYVLSWRSLPGVVTVTLHDRMLMDEILAREAWMPEPVRAAALRVGATGIGGTEVAAAAVRSLNADRQAYARAGARVIAALCATAGQPVDERVLLPTDGQPATAARDAWRAALAPLTTAPRAAAAVEAQLGQVEGLAQLLAPVGFDSGVADGGRLRRQVVDLQDLRTALRRWAAAEHADVSRLAERIATVADMVLTRAQALLDGLDRDLRDLRPLVGDDPRPWRAGLAEALDRLAWVLDGWPYLVSLWASVVNAPLGEQRMAVAEMFRLLPALPSQDGGQTLPSLERDTLAGIRLAWARRRDEVGRGQVDLAGVLSVEALKAGMA